MSKYNKLYAVIHNDGNITKIGICDTIVQGYDIIFNHYIALFDENVESIPTLTDMFPDDGDETEYYDGTNHYLIL